MYVCMFALSNYICFPDRQLLTIETAVDIGIGLVRPSLIDFRDQFREARELLKSKF